MDKYTTNRDKLNSIIDVFVDRHRGMKQRDASWYKVMAVTIGGSEIASLMSVSDNEEFKKLKNPYNSFMDVVKNKIAIAKGINTWTGGGEACWWGILFEDVIMSVVEIEFGSKVKGDDICVQIVEGHRNSPDGYIVVDLIAGLGAGLGRLPLGADIGAGLGRPPLDAGLGRPPLDVYQELYTTDMDPSLIQSSAIVMLEFKCPLSRKPNNEIPKHYVPQLWSGLAVSNIASFGIFVDSVFRKCSLDVLGYNTNYDVSYHYRDFPKGTTRDEKLMMQSIWDLPICWGLIFVYAPVTMLSNYQPDLNTPIQLSGGRPRPAPAPALIDLGKEGFTNFNAVLEQIDLKNYMVKRAMPWFVNCTDKCKKIRGNTKSFQTTINAADEIFNDKYYLLGYIPWKLFYVSYIPIKRRMNFLNEIKPLIDQVHMMVKSEIV